MKEQVLCLMTKWTIFLYLGNVLLRPTIHGKQGGGLIQRILRVPNKFGLYPSKYNYIAPKKRPLSSITPAIIERDGLLEMVLGGSGGSLIPTATLNVYAINIVHTTLDSYFPFRLSLIFWNMVKMYIAQ